MRYTVPTNWQDDLVPALQAMAPAGGPHPVEEIYGQLPRDFVGGGRAPALIGRVGVRQMRAHVAQVRSAGFSFNYTLNATSLGNREWSLLGQWRLDRLLDLLVDCGVDRVTVSLPWLLETIRRRAPSLRVAVSTQALVATPEKARRWQDLGADGITLSVLDVQRDFATLRRIRRAVHIPLQLIGNLLCLHGCPAALHHAAINAHASQVGLSRFAVDWCTLECTHRRLEHPEEIIRAGWIRPEDQHHYEAIGIHRIKLTTRGMHTAAVASILGAYVARSSPPDLMDLFPGPDKSLVFRRKDPLHLLQNYVHPHRVNLVRLSRFQALTRPRDIRIDASALGPDFLAPFLEGRCDPADCGACGYCAAVARRAVKMDPAARAESLARHAHALEEIRTGRLFRWWP